MTIGIVPLYLHLGILAEKYGKLIRNEMHLFVEEADVMN